jgi:hypothetical protein
MPSSTNLVKSTHNDKQPRILLLSSSLLIDRILQYSSYATSEAAYRSTIWATSKRAARSSHSWCDFPYTVEPFPHILPFKEFPYNYFRRFNELVWDYSLQSPSRISQLTHLRRPHWPWYIRLLQYPARMAAVLNAEQKLEENLEKLLMSYNRSQEVRSRLSRTPPQVLVTTGPHRFEEPAVVAEARKLGIPILAFITSWDNISTKNRMVFRYDGFLVWSEMMRKQLYHFYPYSQDVPVYVTGAPQFDAFFQEQFHQSRERFCAEQGLCPRSPIILYALGSPNLFEGEWHAAYRLAQEVVSGTFGSAQLLIRPHPLFDNGGLVKPFSEFGARVVLQSTGQEDLKLVERSQNEREVCAWVNSFRHADVVVNLSSTAAIDGALFDHPIVNLDYDPTPGQPNQTLVKEINHVWEHFQPIAESGGVWLVHNDREMIEAVRSYLNNPTLHQRQRKWIAEYVCGYIDGCCGRRIGEAIIDFLQKNCAKERAESTRLNQFAQDFVQ